MLACLVPCSARTATLQVSIPSVVARYHDLVQLQPVLQSLQYRMITSTLTPELCETREDNYGHMTVAGVLCIGLYEVHYYPKFRSFTIINDVQSAANFVALQRADVSFMADPMLARITEDVRSELTACENYRKQFDFFPYLHRDFLWAKEVIESALNSEFARESDR